jgi:hypothetical protein
MPSLDAIALKFDGIQRLHPQRWMRCHDLSACERIMQQDNGGVSNTINKQVCV